MKSINNIFKKVCILAIVTSMAGCDMLDTKPYDFVAPLPKSFSICFNALSNAACLPSTAILLFPLFCYISINIVKC